MWQEKLQDTAASHPWLEPHEAIKRKTQAPGMQLVDWYGFTVPKTIEVNFYNHESKEAHTIQVNPFAASKANKAAREAFFERKDAEREQGKSLGAKAASARGASEKLDGQTQAAPAKDNLEH